MRATGAGVGALALGSMATGGASAADGRLETNGKWIVDGAGETFVPRGFAVAALDFLDESHPKSVQEVLDLATSEEWHPNTIRLPITEWAVHDYGMDYVVNDLLRPAVDYLADEGVYATIDFHLIRPYTAAEEIAPQLVEDGWADSVENLGFKYDVGTDDLLTDFWGAVAPEFADDEHVLFELFNEPTLPNWWSSYTDEGSNAGTREATWLLWRDEAQPWVDLIRQEAPETPIIIGSPDWTSETQFAPQYPFDGENLIYSGHIYPDNGQPNEFDPEYGAPADDVPVIITEFGWDPDEEFSENVEYGTTSEWGEPFRQWADGYENMGWFGWCFDDSWAPTYFESPGEGAGEPWNLKTGAEQQGWFMQEWLTETAGEEPADPQPPSAPTGLSASTTDSSADLSWDTVDGAEHYTVTVDGEFEAEVSTTQATVTDLDPDTSYTFGVSAGNADGDSAVTTETATTDAGDGDPEPDPEPDDYVAEANPSTTDATVGQNVTFQIDDTSGDSTWITDLEWDFGDGTTGGGWWAQHSWSSTGTYTVGLTATDNEGTSTTHEVDIVVS